MNSYSKNVFIAYITEGRDKYEYSTTIVGIFMNKNDALFKIFEKLYNDGKILMDDYFADMDDYAQEIFKDVASYNKFDEYKGDHFPFHLLHENIDLESVIYGYHDSYYEDGWDYTIKEMAIE